jgi:hypothetical protein
VLGVQQALELALLVQKSELQIVVVPVQEPMVLMALMRRLSKIVTQPPTARYLSTMLALLLDSMDWQEPADWVALV